MRYLKPDEGIPKKRCFEVKCDFFDDNLQNIA